MKTIEDIKNEIERLNKAIDNDNFVKNPDGTKLQEHVYHQRLGAITFLTWVIEEELEQHEDIPDTPY